MTFDSDFQHSRLYLRSLRAITGLVTAREATQEQDQKENTDLIVLETMAGIRFACRVRRPKDFARYGDEFTLRVSRPGGTKTELAKVAEGWGDYIIYAWGSDRPPKLIAWSLGDLSVFRAWRDDFIRFHGVEPGLLKPNVDGSSCFRAYKIADLPPAFLVDSHGIVKRAAA